METVALAVLKVISFPISIVLTAKLLACERHRRKSVGRLLTFFVSCLMLVGNGPVSSGLAITIDAPTDMATNNADIFIVTKFLFTFLSLDYFKVKPNSLFDLEY